MEKRLKNIRKITFLGLLYRDLRSDGQAEDSHSQCGCEDGSEELSSSSWARLAHPPPHNRPFHSQFYRLSYIKGPKRLFFLHFAVIFSAVSPYIWPLAGPNIVKKGWPLLGKALERVWEGFGKAQLSSRDQVGC